MLRPLVAAVVFGSSLLACGAGAPPVSAPVTTAAPALAAEPPADATEATDPDVRADVEAGAPAVPTTAPPEQRLQLFGANEAETSARGRA